MRVEVEVASGRLSFIANECIHLRINSALQSIYQLTKQLDNANRLATVETSEMEKSNRHQRRGFFLWLSELDRILRGDATRPADIQAADIKIPVVGVAVVVILLAVIYGFCMGIFALVRGVENSAYQQALMQTFASMCKVPLLFFLTLVVTFPSLYVFNALVGSRLRVLPVLKLLVASLAVNLAVLASMGPILAFFSVSTPNYPFIVLLNVVVFAVAGVLGLAFLIQTLNRLSLAEQELSASGAQRETVHARRALPSAEIDRAQPRVMSISDQPKTPPKPSEPIPDASPKTAASSQSSPKFQPVTATRSPVTTSCPGISAKRKGPLDHLEGIVFGRHVRKVFTCWIVVFGLVGAQMGWVLRPFIGSPNQPFYWFRARHSNFFESVINTLFELF